jgi:hypothetical protein
MPRFLAASHVLTAGIGFCSLAFPAAAQSNVGGSQRALEGLPADGSPFDVPAEPVSVLAGEGQSRASLSAAQTPSDGRASAHLTSPPVEHVVVDPAPKTSMARHSSEHSNPSAAVDDVVTVVPSRSAQSAPGRRTDQPATYVVWRF